MQTQSHALIGAYFFGQRDAVLMTVASLAGMAPDVPMFVTVAMLRLQGHSARQIFGHDYFQPWWQHINGVSHSLILWPIALLFALAARRLAPAARWPARPGHPKMENAGNEKKCGAQSAPRICTYLR